MLRILMTAVLLLLPTTSVLADDAGLLGPQSTTSTTSDGSTGSSTATGGVLQPAGTPAAPLQSTNTGNADLGQPSSQTLQQAGGADAAKLLIQGDIDPGSTSESGHDLAWLGYVFAVLGILTAATGAAWLIERQRLTQQISK